jgi:hypothetical protein
MIHACLHTICFVFCYTSWHFYAFSGTNLLMRCHSASSLFSAIFVFQKSYTGNILGISKKKEIFSELDETKAKSSIFPEASRSPKIRQRGARSQAHPRVARPTPGPRHQGVRPAGPPPDAAVSPIYSPRWEKPKGRIAFPRNILQAATIVIARLGGSRSSSRHPAEEGNPCRRPSPPPWSPLE